MSRSDDSLSVGGEFVSVEETRAGHFQVAVLAGGSRFLADEPESVGGLGTGPNPYELLSAALGACTTMTLRLYADRKAWPIARVSVKVSHVRATLSARDRFERQIVIDGELDTVQRKRLLEIANRCPVHLMLERGAEVNTLLVPSETNVAASNARDVGQHMRHVGEACSDEDCSQKVS